MKPGRTNPDIPANSNGPALRHLPWLLKGSPFDAPPAHPPSPVGSPSGRPVSPNLLTGRRTPVRSVGEAVSPEWPGTVRGGRLCLRPHPCGCHGHPHCLRRIAGPLPRWQCTSVRWSAARWRGSASSRNRDRLGRNRQRDSHPIWACCQLPTRLRGRVVAHSSTPRMPLLWMHAPGRSFRVGRHPGATGKAARTDL